MARSIVGGLEDSLPKAIRSAASVQSRARTSAATPSRSVSSQWLRVALGSNHDSYSVTGVAAGVAFVAGAMVGGRSCHRHLRSSAVQTRSLQAMLARHQRGASGHKLWSATSKRGCVTMRAKGDASAVQSIKPTFDFAYWAEHVEEVQTNAENRNFQCDVPRIVDLYNEYRSAEFEAQQMRKESNAHSRKLKGKMEKEQRDLLIQEGKAIKERVTAQEDKVDELYDELLGLAVKVPNLTHPDVPVGPEENANVLHIHGTPRTSEDAGFELKDHLQLGEKLGLFDFESGAKVSGQKFVYFRGGAALLEMALVQWTMHQAFQRGFMPVMPPDLVREQVVAGCGFQPRDGEATQIYAVKDSDLRLAGTAEIPLGGIFCNEILVGPESLPQRLVAFGHAFRTEAGSSGSENRGVYRLHQFSKVELFAVTRGNLEESDKMLDEIREFEEELYSKLGFCFRVLDMPTEELGAPAYRKFDIEAWMPGMQKWGEISSCSNCTDFQARRLNLRYKESYQQKKQLEYLHTLNGTGCAVPRMLITILETFQNEDGSVTIPEVLRPYMPNGMERLEPAAVKQHATS